MIRAVALGAAVVLGVGVPVALVGSLVLDDGSNLVFPLAALVVVAFVAGGWLAARHGGAAPLVAGGLAALAGYAVAQAVSVTVRAVQDDDVQPVAIAASAVVAVGCGLAGGALGAKR